MKAAARDKEGQTGRSPGRNAPPDLEPRAVSQAIALAAIAVLCLVAVYLTPLKSLFHVEQLEELRRRIDALGAAGPIFLLLATAVGVSFGVPRVFFAALSGVVCGWLLGTVVAQLGTIVGCVATFSLARKLGREFVKQRLGVRFGRLARLLGRLEHHGVAGNLLVRSAPVGNCFAVNLVMGSDRSGSVRSSSGRFSGPFPQRSSTPCLAVERRARRKSGSRRRPCCWRPSRSVTRCSSAGRAPCRT